MFLSENKESFLNGLAVLKHKRQMFMTEIQVKEDHVHGSGKRFFS